MDISKISLGSNPPEELNVIIEVPLGGDPIKYELDKESGALFVDRFLYTAMTYPCNYGFVPHTLSDDGDPIDVMVYGSRPIIPGGVVAVRPIGVLMMEDEAGIDEKVFAVPTYKLTKRFDRVKDYNDVPEIMLQRISHFFEQYKALEPDKWVKVIGWEGIDVAQQVIIESIERYNKKP